VKTKPIPVGGRPAIEDFGLPIVDSGQGRLAMPGRGMSNEPNWARRGGGGHGPPYRLIGETPGGRGKPLSARAESPEMSNKPNSARVSPGGAGRTREIRNPKLEIRKMSDGSRMSVEMTNKANSAARDCFGASLLAMTTMRRRPDVGNEANFTMGDLDRATPRESSAGTGRRHPPACGGRGLKNVCNAGVGCV